MNELTGARGVRAPEPGCSLADLRPDIAAEWHLEKNGDLTPRMVTVGPARKVWWLCPAGHDYEATINNRTGQGSGCRYCSGQAVLARFNDLAARRPDIAAEWHPEKNGDLTPQDVMPGSNRKAWWLCPEGHGYEAVIWSRTKPDGSGCRYCSGQAVLAGFNDLAAKRPDIAAEWHPEKNGDLTPQDVMPGSHLKAWWRCPDGHAYEAKIGHRTVAGSGCPQCSGRVVITGFSDLAVRFPDIAAEWHPGKNGALTPQMVTASSGRKAWWLCPKGHAYKATISNRTGAGSGCPYCSGLAVLAGFNDLAAKRPDIAAEWHPEKNGDLTPQDVMPGSERKAWWLCPEGHAYEAMIYNRAKPNGTGCPYCAGRTVLAGFNGLAVERPHIAAEWHPGMNGNLTPQMVAVSSGRKAWWLCPEGHAYEATINHRSGRGDGCPNCAGKTVLAGFNDLATKRPDIAGEWDPERNGDLTPQMVTVGSNRKAWWLCPDGHDYESVIAARTGRGGGCYRCNSGWTRKNIGAFLRDIRDGGHLDDMRPYELLTFCLQNGMISSGNKAIAKQLLSGKLSIPEFIDAIDNVAGDGKSDIPAPGTAQWPADDRDDDDPELTVESLAVQAAADGGEEMRGGSAGDAGMLPSDTVAAALNVPEELFATVDSEALDFLVAARVARLWAVAYREDAGLEPGGTTASQTAELRDGTYAEMVRARFRREYDDAVAMRLPGGWSFEPGGPGTGIVKPNLMQRHVATSVVRDRRRGNWSGTGAGKTVSAVLAARLLDAGKESAVPGGQGGLIVVVCPNNTIAGWTRTITGCFPGSRVQAKTLGPSFEAGAAGQRWLVVNYERFQQDVRDDMSRLLDLYRIDFLVIDEVHMAKHRDKSEASRRRLALEALAAEAGRRNPDMAVLAMSATPVVNDLHEARSLLEITEGVKFSDVQVNASAANAHRIFQRLVRVGSRCMPEYAVQASSDEVRIDVTHRLDDIRALGRRASVADIERLLIAEKLEEITSRCSMAKAAGRKTLIYSEYLDGVAGPLREAIKAAGLSVGMFCGTDKTGLSRFTGKDFTSGEERPVPQEEQVDVLIGSPAIGTGVDGLQHVCDQLIFATLPWTNAAFVQVVGRVVRQGQASGKVDVVIPVTYSALDPEEHDGREEWSWCGYRVAVIRHKRSLADAAVDGAVLEGEPVTRERALRDLMSWLGRIEDGAEVTVSRAPLDSTLESLVADRVVHGTARRALSEFSRVNRAWNASRSQVTHGRLASSPSEWHEYHAMYARARESWEVIPAHVFARWLNEHKRSRHVADLGCGEMLLADKVTGPHEVFGFDHVAIDDRVTACDIADLPVHDASMDIAVLSLALMGSNYAEYLREAHRILDVGGQLWIAETASRAGNASEANQARVRASLAGFGFSVVSVEQVGDFLLVSATRAARAPLGEPEPFLLPQAQR